MRFRVPIIPSETGSIPEHFRCFLTSPACSHGRVVLDSGAFPLLSDIARLLSWPCCSIPVHFRCFRHRPPALMALLLDSDAFPLLSGIARLLSWPCCSIPVHFHCFRHRPPALMALLLDSGVFPLLSGIARLLSWHCCSIPVHFRCFLASPACSHGLVNLLLRHFLMFLLGNMGVLWHSDGHHSIVVL